MLLAALLIPSGAAAQIDEDDDIVIMDQFTVRSAADDRYRAANAITASKMPSAIKDTPMNIAVITEDFLDDLKIDDMVDSFSYTSGINTNPDGVAEGSPTASQIRIRGFSGGLIFRDGYVKYYNFNMDGVDRVEIVKGPVGAFYGRAEPGGIINFISKRPKYIWEQTLELTAGSDSYYKALVDSTGPIIEDMLAYRVVASYQDSEEWRDFVQWERKFIYASLHFAPFETMEFFVNYERNDSDRYGGNASGFLTNPLFHDEEFNTQLVAMENERRAALGLGPLPERYEFPNMRDSDRGVWRAMVLNNLGYYPPRMTTHYNPLGFSHNRMGPGAFNKGLDEIVSADMRWEIFDGLNFRFGFNWLTNDEQSLVTHNADLYQDNRTMTFDPGRTRGTRHKNERFSYQSDLIWRFDLWGTTQTFLLTGEYRDDKYYAPEAIYDEEWLGAGEEFWTRDLFSEPIPDISDWFVGWTETFTGNVNDEYGYGISYEGRYFEDKLILRLGWRREEKEQGPYTKSTPDGDPVKGPTGTSTGETPMFGLAYKVTDDITVFAAYSESFTPPAQSINGTYIVYNPDLPPTDPAAFQTLGGEALEAETGLGYEVGVKTELFDRKISGTLSLFRVDKDNIARRNVGLENELRERSRNIINGVPEVIISNSAELWNTSGLNRVEGIDADFIISPNQNWQIVVGASWYFTREIVEPDPIQMWGDPRLFIPNNWYRDVTRASRNSDAPRPDGLNLANNRPSDPSTWEDDVYEPKQYTTLEYIPEFQLGVFNKYSFTEGRLEGFSAGLGMRYESSQLADQSRDWGFSSDAFTVWDLLFEYDMVRWNLDWNFRLNVRNALDKQYYVGRQGTADPREIFFTTVIKY